MGRSRLSQQETCVSQGAWRTFKVEDSGLVQPQLQHTTHISLPFEVVCHRLTAEAGRVAAGSSTAAVRHIERSARKAGLAGFKRGTAVELDLSPLERVSDDFARVGLDWRSGADDQRLLPHVEAQLLIHAVIAKGVHASTAVSVVGRFAPSKGARRQIEDLLFGRRIVDEAMQRFLDALAVLVVDDPIDLRVNLTQPASA